MIFEFVELVTVKVVAVSVLVEDDFTVAVIVGVLSCPLFTIRPLTPAHAIVVLEL